MSDAERPECPECGARLRAVLFGEPGFVVRDDPDRELVLGGCFIEGQDPQWDCGHCHVRWIGTMTDVLPVRVDQPLPEVVLFIERHLYEETRRMAAAGELTAWGAEAEHAEHTRLLSRALEALTGRPAAAIRARVNRQVARDAGPPPVWAPGSAGFWEN